MARALKDGPIAATALAQLVTCETRLLLDAQHGPARTVFEEQRRQEGLAEHAEQDQRVQAHHNARDRRCFVATCIYGPTAWQTDRLRGFRDATLARSVLGRVAIALYYRVAPALIPWLERAPRLRGFARSWLDRLVHALADAH